jgi:hypothetical protein
VAARALVAKPSVRAPATTTSLVGRCLFAPAPMLATNGLSRAVIGEDLLWELVTGSVVAILRSSAAPHVGWIPDISP